MPQPNISTDAITEHLRALLFEALSPKEVKNMWKDYQPGDAQKGQDTSTGKEVAIFTDQQEQLTYDPAVEILFDHDENEIISISTQEKKYYFNILVSTTNNNPKHSSAYNTIVSDIVFDTLNAFTNRNFKIPGYEFCAYYSEATTKRQGFRRGKGLRTSQIEWYCKVLFSNRT